MLLALNRSVPVTSIRVTANAELNIATHMIVVIESTTKAEIPKPRRLPRCLTEFRFVTLEADERDCLTGLSPLGGLSFEIAEFFATFSKLSRGA